jgi:FkbM family methyltransferase
MPSIKYKIRKTLMDLTGYFIYKRSGLPIGVDLREDLLNKFGFEPKIVFDVGANIGQTALSYAEMFPSASIFSFEPFEEAFHSLERNTSHLQRVKRFQIALGETAAHVDVRIHDEKYSYLNSLKSVNENQSGSASVERITVSTLDGFCNTNEVKEIDLLKIDTEGYEVEVLRGGNELLKTGRISAILCEVSLARQDKRHTQLFDLQDYLEPYGYFFVGLYDSNLNYYREGIAYSNALFVLPGKTTDHFAGQRLNDRTSGQ